MRIRRRDPTPSQDELSQEYSEAPYPNWLSARPAELEADLRMNNDKLVGAYLSAIGRASKLQPLLGNGKQLPGSSSISEQRTISRLSLGFLVRLFVEGHVRTKAGELRRLYLQTREAIPPDSEHRGLATWLEQAAIQWKQVEETISRRAYFLRLLLALTPFAVGLLAARLGKTDIYAALVGLHLSAYRSASFWLVVPALYLLLLVSSSFQFKRCLFLPRHFYYDHPGLNRNAENLSSRNTYAIEDRIWHALDRGKNREVQWDIHASWIADILTIGTIVLLILRPFHSGVMQAVALVLAILAGIVVFGTLDWVVLPFRRKYR